MSVAVENGSCTESSDGGKKWLDAHYDPLAALYTFTQCIALSDISADADHKLIIADLGTGSYEMKLKVYKGTSLMSENAIVDLPTGVVTFYMDLNEPRTPAVAVASGPYIFVYKNLRPYFKFTLPSLMVEPREELLWEQLRESQVSKDSLIDGIEILRNEGAVLTVRSLKLLQLSSHDQDTFISKHKNTALKRQTVITCLNTLKKSMAEEDAVSCLVLGTEDKSVYILDTEAFIVLTTMTLPSVPFLINASGMYDIEFRIILACRNGGVYAMKRGSTTGKLCFELNSQPVGLQRIGKSIVVACMDNSLLCYTTKGKKLWKVKLPGSVMTMEMMDHHQHGFRAVMVALSNSEVHIYQDKYLCDVIKVPDVVSGMKFGRFGREDSTLIMTTCNGGLIIKILKRTATFEKRDIAAGPPASQNIKLSIPKKTKLFVDQTLRERENAVSMHRQFQHDLYRLRLETARHYVRALQKSMSPITSSPAEPLKLSAQVQGIGPTFKLTINLQNTSLTTPSMNLFISFQYDDSLYAFHKTLMHVPMLVPGLSYAFETFIECLSDKGIADIIKVFVLKRNTSAPILTAFINMPVSETLLVG